MKLHSWLRPLALAAAAGTALVSLGACAPLVVGAAVGGSALVAMDRRTSGAQVEDQAIELKGAARVRELATLGNVSVTSYNRMVLITGDVPTADDRQRVEDALMRLENVRSVVDELAVGTSPSLAARSQDAIVSAKVKASFVDAKDLHANAVKVVTERGVVYLMGRVTEREARRAADVASTVPGVKKVVRVFDVISEEELAGMVKPTAKTEPDPPPK